MINKTLATAAAGVIFASLAAGAAVAEKPRQIEAPALITGSAAGEREALTTLWIDGKRQELTGLDEVETADKALKKAQKAEAKSAGALAKAQGVSDDQRAAYKKLVEGFGEASDPKSIDKEIKALRKAKDNWSDALKSLKKAEEKLIEARSEVAAAESAQRTANEQVSLGRLKMQQAEERVRQADVGPPEMARNEQ